MSGHKRLFKPSVMTLALVAAGLQTQPVLAADEEAKDIERIEVTTQRRTQSIQDVSATVQSFSGDQLQALAVNNDFQNLQNVVSGLHIAKQEGKVEVYLRGIGSSDSDFSSDPSVATHYNGVYLPRPRSIGPMFFDVERVEVNKGPQGTLRGRNATGGAINIISKRPEFDEFYGYAQVGLGNFDLRTTETVINMPLSDTLAVRAAIATDKHDSHYSNAYGDAVEAPGALDNAAYRLSLLWEPNDRFSAYILADKVDEEGTGYPGAFTGRALSAGYDVDELDDPWNQYFKTTGAQSNDIRGFATTLTYNFDRFSVEYNGSLRSYEFSNRNASREWQLGMVYPGSDAEASYQAYFRDDYPADGARANAFPQRLNMQDTFFQSEESSTITHELRFFSDDSGDLVWSAGAFYLKEEYDYVSWNLNDGAGYTVDCWFQEDTLCAFQDGLGGENRGDGSEVESKAVFGDITYKLSDKTRVLAGLRWSEDKKTANESNIKYMLMIPDALVEEYGLSVNKNTAPFVTGLTLGGNGVGLTAPGDRGALPTTICSGWDPCGDGYTADPYNLAYFLSGINFGNGDNLDDFLTQYADQVEVRVQSDFYTDDNPYASSSDVYEDDYIDWRLGIEHDLSKDHMLYATLSTGTRSGGINRPIVLASGEKLARSWEPEELLVYELGSKMSFEVGDYPVVLNTALFYYDYTDKVVQNLVSVPDPLPDDPERENSFVFSANSADASLLGLEIDGRMGLPYDLSLNWNFAYLDSEFKDSRVLDTRGGNNLVSIDGNRLPNTSKVNLNLKLSQFVELDWGALRSFDWTISASYRSSYYLTPYNNKGYAVDDSGNSYQIPLIEMTPGNNLALSDTGGESNGLFFSDEVDAYTQINLNAGFNFGRDEQFRVDAYINNVTEEVYSGKGFINESVNIRFLNSPRTWGVRFKAMF